MSEWNGFKSEEFVFEGQKAIIVFPDEANEKKKWILKTEYLYAFPNFDIEMLKRGYHLVNIENETRWCKASDTERQANLSKFVIEKYGLNDKCAVLGLSCGGMQAVYLAAKHTDLVSVLYLDAPVLNLLSCPCGVGKSTNEMYIEFTNAMGLTVSQLINYREHPIDYVPLIIENNIPVFLVCGDSDNVVPYSENGEILAQMYEASEVPFSKVIKSGCGHHPHSLTDCTEIIEFIEKYYDCF